MYSYHCLTLFFRIFRTRSQVRLGYMQLPPPTQTSLTSSSSCPTQTVEVLVTLHRYDYELMQMAGRISREDVARFLVTSGYLRAKQLIGDTCHGTPEFQRACSEHTVR